MDSFFLTVVNMSLTGSIAILAVLLVRLLLKRVPKLFSYLLWIVVLFRLICPFALSTRVGLPQVMINNQGTSIPTAFQTTEPTNGMEDHTNLGQQNQQILNQNHMVSNKNEMNEVQTAQNISSWNRMVMVAEYVWMIGVLILLLYSLVSYWHLKQILKDACFVDSNIFELEKLPTPFVLGFIKPCIYLPMGITGEERKYILAHERMHIKRGDYLVKLIGFLAATLHWMNPLVWIAFLCMSKDMEMSCDEAVIRNFGIEIKKKYSTSLLHMAMPQKRINMAPLAFGEGNVKSRIQNVLKYKKAGIGILTLCGCILGVVILILTTNRTTPENQIRMSRVGETGVDNSSILQEHRLNAEAKSYMLFSVAIADGQEVERTVIASGNITDENRNGDLNISFQYMTEEDPRLTITATENSNSQSKTFFLSDYTMRAGNIMWDHEPYHDIATNVAYLLTAEYIGSKKTTAIEAFDCEDLVNDEATWDFAMEQSTDAGVSMFMMYYVIFDKNIEELSIEPENFPLHITTGDTTVDEPVLNSSDEELTLIESQITKWAQAFCDRDGEVIISMLSDEVKEQMSESGMLEVVDGSAAASFGTSSPWPMESDNAYRIININAAENKAEILYYAITSDPHVSVGQEEISYTIEDEEFVIVSEELKYLDHISSFEEYQIAYPDEIIDNTNMDYESNGMGQALNDHALLSSSYFYSDLFQPDTAAINLLNLNSEEVQVNWGYLDDGSDDVFAQLVFDKTNDTITIKMIQPYGSEGIWIPKNMKSSENVIGKDAMERFMEIPWDEIEAGNLKFTGDILTNREIQCIGEIPEYQIKLFGYGDDEFWGEGVAIQIGDDVNYFDWNYMSTRILPPSVYWKDSERQLQAALKIYAGTGVAAEELHILQQYETGHLSDYVFALEDYSKLLSETIDYEYDQNTKRLQLIDSSSHTVLAEIENVDAPDGISELELGMISSFLLGDQIILQVETGYIPNGSLIAEYENMPVFHFPVMCEYDENEILQFSLGKPEVAQ